MIRLGSFAVPESVAYHRNAITMPRIVGLFVSL